MKITHILPPLTRGGAERVAVDLANQAARAGHEVTLVSAYPVASESRVDGIDPRVAVQYVTGRPSRFGKYALLGPWLIARRDWLLGQDVIHCHLTFGAVAGTAVQMLRRAFSRRRPVVVETFHAVGMPIPGWKRALAATLAASRNGFALMADDPYWKAFARANPNLRVRIIPNGVAARQEPPSAQELAAYRQSIGIPEGVRIVGTIGRISADRMPLKMIDLFAQLASAGGSDVHFLVGGDGPLLGDARSRASQLGIGQRTHFPGLVTRPQLAFGLIDLYVSINVGPNTGIAGLEAAAAGTPLIALQALGDYSGGDEDWIWSSPDLGEVARKAAELLADEEEAAELAARQSWHVRSNLSLESMGDAYQKLYEECALPG